LLQLAEQPHSNSVLRSRAIRLTVLARSGTARFRYSQPHQRDPFRCPNPVQQVIADPEALLDVSPVGTYS